MLFFSILDIFNKGEMMKKIIKLLLVVLWMGLIFSFSSDPADISTKKSDGVIIKTIEFILDKNLSNQEKEKWISYFVVPVRKGAHFFVYLVLGILIINFCYEFFIFDKKLILLSVFLAFLYACTDEIHQLFVPGRSGQISDIILDTLGSLTGIMIYKLIYNKFKGEKV